MADKERHGDYKVRVEVTTVYEIEIGQAADAGEAEDRANGHVWDGDLRSEDLYAGGHKVTQIATPSGWVIGCSEYYDFDHHEIRHSASVSREEHGDLRHIVRGTRTLREALREAENWIELAPTSEA